MRTTILLAATAAALTLAGCGLASGDDDADNETGADPTASSSSEHSTTEAAWPRTVTNCGREVTIEAEPQRIVGIEGAAETVLALGGAQQMVGYFGNEAAELPGELGAEAAKTDYLGGSFPTPNLEAILEPEPDLLVLYGFSEEAGLTEQRLDELGVPTLVLSETCAEGADATVEGYFGDVTTFAHAIGADESGEELIEEWRARIAAATATPVAEPRSVFVMGSTDPTSPFASGGGSLANDQIEIAGGTNVFGDTKEAFLSPSWEEIATRNPDIIVDGSGGLEESLKGLRSYLRDDAALSEMNAVRDDAFLAIDYYDNVPGPRVVDGVVKLAEYMRS